jgi:chromosome segregation ATPase
MGRGLLIQPRWGRTLDQYAVEIGLALVVLTTGAAAWIVSRRRYVKSADFKRGMEALRLEFRRSLDDTRTATVKRAATIGDNLLSVIKPIDVAVTDLNVRLERLEEHADAVSSFMAGPQRHALEDNERIDARLTKVEQSLKTLIEQLSLLKQTIDEVTAQELETGSSIESLDSRLMDTRKQADGLSSRLELGEKARADLGSLIGLFVKQLKRVNVSSAETALRVADLEGLRSKVSGLEARLSPVAAQDKSISTGNSTENNSDLNGDTPMKAADALDSSETDNGGENIIEQPMISTKEAADATGVRVETHSENGSAGQHPA